MDGSSGNFRHFASIPAEISCRCSMRGSAAAAFPGAAGVAAPCPDIRLLGHPFLQLLGHGVHPLPTRPAAFTPTPLATAAAASTVGTNTNSTRIAWPRLGGCRRSAVGPGGLPLLLLVVAWLLLLVLLLVVLVRLLQLMPLLLLLLAAFA